MSNYGLIDLGSNSIRLVIYEVDDESPEEGQPLQFRSLINDKVMAGLAAYVSDGVFSQAGIKRATNVLLSHARHAEYFDCKKLEVFATAALRNSVNSRQAVAAIREQTGLPITLLSEQDEAHLGFVGSTCERLIDEGTLIDIGGGSTELTRIEDGQDFDHVSLAQGSLSSFANHVEGVIPTQEELEAIVRDFRKRFKKLGLAGTYNATVLYGIGGSVRAAAKMYAQMTGESTRPKTMSKQQVKEIIDWSLDDPGDFAHTALKASAERVHTVVPGCAILYTLFEELGAERLEVGKRGVREGYLVERMLQ